MSGGGEIIVRPAGTPALAQVEQTPEEKLLAMWLARQRSRHTRRAYAADWARFRRQVAAPLDQITLGDLQAFAGHLAREPGRAPGAVLRDGSRHRIMASVKSFIAFCVRLGVLQFDVGSLLRMPSERDALNERILDEADVRQLIAAAAEGRDRLMVRMLYFSGCRVSELIGVRWCDLRARGGGAGQVTLLGKGGKTRSVLLPADLFAAVLERRGTAGDADRVFALSVSQAARIVKGAAMAAGVSTKVSPHWLRHCHCSHALDHGAPIHLVQATVGHASVATTSRYLHARPAESSSSFLDGGGGAGRPAK